MKALDNCLFILWAAGTIILIGIGFIILPVLLLIEMIRIELLNEILKAK